jgi:hypothetical protein
MDQPYGIPLDAAESDQAAMQLILTNLRAQRDAKVEERPLEALALALAVESAENMCRSSRILAQVHRENQANALHRAVLERRKAIDGLEQRLLKAPVTALSEAENSAAGCARVVELWRYLGESLTGSEGWNAAETKLAWALIGSTTPGVRTSRLRSKLEDAVQADRRRPAVAANRLVDRLMNGYVRNLLDGLATRMNGDMSLHAAILEFVGEKAMELGKLLDPKDREALELMRKDREMPQAGRKVWISTRRFVSERIREWRQKKAVRESAEAISAASLSFESFGPAEMKKAEWARKGAGAAIADFQKTLALAKSLGLIESSPSKSAKGPEALRAQGFVTDGTMDVGREIVTDLQLKSDERVVKAKVAQPRRTQPRNALGQFVSAQSLRSTEQGRKMLTALIEANLKHREAAMNDAAKASETGESGDSAGFAVSGSGATSGTAIALAEFSENVQNDVITHRRLMPVEFDEPPAKPKPSAEDDRQAGDDAR